MSLAEAEPRPDPSAEVTGKTSPLSQGGLRAQCWVVVVRQHRVNPELKAKCYWRGAALRGPSDGDLSGHLYRSARVGALYNQIDIGPRVPYLGFPKRALLLGKSAKNKSERRESLLVCSSGTPRHLGQQALWRLGGRDLGDEGRPQEMANSATGRLRPWVRRPAVASGHLRTIGC